MDPGAGARVAVAVVDDHPAMRSGLRGLIEGERYAVVVSAHDGEDYIRQSTERPVRLALVDLCMPRMDGWATIAWIRAHQPGVLPMALSFDDRPDWVQRAMRAGARGMLCKSIGPAELHKALDDLHRSGFHHNALTERYILAPAAARGQAPPEGPALLQRLSPRERATFDLVLHDPPLTFAQIALRLGVSRNTVESYRKGIVHKLGLHTREDMLHFAARHGLLGNGR